MATPPSQLITHKWLAQRGDEITRVECIRESEASVWLANGSRRDKQSTSRKYPHRYCETWEEARAELLIHAERKLNDARRQLERAQGLHGNLVGMKPPAEAA